MLILIIPFIEYLICLNLLHNLKICTQCLPYMKEMNNNIQKLNAAIVESKTKLLDLNIAVSPVDCFSMIQESIKL